MNTETKHPVVEKTLCVRCREPVYPDAQICPHCRSEQQRDYWKLLADGLKWAGGIAAVVSLLIGITQLNKLLVSWKETKNAVSELITATEIRQAAGDFQSAWNLIGQALDIDPASEQARNIQIKLAMDWVRRLNYMDEKKAQSIRELLLPPLYRGAASNDRQYAADVMAHIAWLDWGAGSGKDIDGQLQRALALEKNNMYANVMLGYRILFYLRPGPNAGEQIDQAMAHFETALKTKRDRFYVRKYQFQGLCSAGGIGERKALQLANALRKKDEDIGLAACKKVLGIYRILWLDESSKDERTGFLLTSLPPEDLLKTYLYLNKDIDYIERTGIPVYFDIHTHKFIIARLTENTGGLKKAASMYRELIDAFDKMNLSTASTLNRKVEMIRRAYERVSAD